MSISDLFLIVSISVKRHHNWSGNTLCVDYWLFSPFSI